MVQWTVECLNCGDRRHVAAANVQQADTGECLRCGYVGWASTTDLNEYARRALRDRPVERRRLRAAS
jgi:Zn ribbon nucleic-acid-binding protein